MKLILKNKTVTVAPMAIPEPRSRTYIEYEYERNTNHLTPKLTVNGRTFIGERIYVPFPDNDEDAVVLTVALVDNDNVPVKIYNGTLSYNEYIILGTHPIYLNMIRYIEELEARIRQLEEEGEVI